MYYDLIFRRTTFGCNNVRQTIRHGFDQLLNEIQRDFIPQTANPSFQSFLRSWRAITDPKTYPRPHVLNRIKVWALWRVLEGCHGIFIEKIENFLCLVIKSTGKSNWAKFLGNSSNKRSI
ncbi:hypothetical protein Ae201684_002514 [Aphanomyces euteiches]|uniref:Uncharacterized protein n=1 Tax=Aphanomyces euteiches TaxID=100861 RepID=A0A6G0XQN0_9STRA|nr:hypothetical protein Ae201684_002514 [Aphanomyces euteiches]